MKKTYMTPVIETYHIHSNAQLLAGSLELSGEYSGGDVLSREFDEESDFDSNFDSGLEDFE